jgi:hypothetical protein
MEQASLSDQIDFGLAVEDSRMASVRTFGLHYLTCPSDTDTGVYTVFDEVNAPLCRAATNSYVACFGAYGLINTDPDKGNGLFQRNSHIRLAQITDGLSQTVAVGERPAMFAKAPWAGVMTTGTVRTTPGAPVYSSTVELAPTMVLARAANRSLNSPYSEPYDFFSPHGELIYFVLADASVQGLTAGLDLDVFHALATRAERD